MSIDAAKKVVSETVKSSKNLFNAEVKAFRDQHWKMMALIDYFEKELTS